jgi:hypothetical protein
MARFEGIRGENRGFLAKAPSPSSLSNQTEQRRGGAAAGASGSDGRPASRPRRRSARGGKGGGRRGELIPLTHLGSRRLEEANRRRRRTGGVGLRWWLGVDVQRGNGGLRWLGGAARDRWPLFIGGGGGFGKGDIFSGEEGRRRAALGPAGSGRRATGLLGQGRRSSSRRRVSSILWRRGGRPTGPAGGSAGGVGAAV